MNRKQVLVRTAKGQDEVLTKAYHLPPELRHLLIRVDEDCSVGETLDQFAGSADKTASQLETLVAEGFLAPQESMPEMDGLNVDQWELLAAGLLDPRDLQPEGEAIPECAFNLEKAKHDARLILLESLSPVEAHHVERIIGSADRVRAARERVLARGRQQMVADLQECGDALTVGETAQLLGLSLDEVKRLAKAGELFGLPMESGPVFPSVQFHDSKVLVGLIEALAAFPDPNPWARLNYLVNPDLRLQGRRPIDCLIAGDIASVIQSARQVGEQSAA